MKPARVPAAPRIAARVLSIPAIVPLDAYFDTLLALAERAERAEILKAAA
jgi:hypothetical protein